MSEKIKALLATGRISNLPTVWCNCMAATLILFHQSQKGFLDFIEQPWSQQLTYLAIFLVVISSCFYVGGCFMGDYYDRDFDAKHKPDRPIVSGVLNEKTVKIIGITLMITALAGTTYLPHIAIEQFKSILILAPAILLFFAIQLYSEHHKKSLYIALPLIGLCRFSLIIFAASASALLLDEIDSLGHYVHLAKIPIFTSTIILYASAVCLYTICFASVARTESSDSPITWRNILRYTMLGLPFVALISKGEFHGAYLAIAAMVAFAVYALWLLRAFQFLEKNKGIYVSKCLAGFCLLDACFVAQFGWIWFVICLALFGLALLLQRIAPAT